MKIRYLLAIACCLLLQQFTYAQNSVSKTQAHTIAAQYSAIVDGLDQTQLDRIESLQLQLMDDLTQVKTKYGENSTEVQDEHETLITYRNKKLKFILTTQQYQQFMRYQQVKQGSAKEVKDDRSPTEIAVGIPAPDCIERPAGQPDVDRFE